MTRFFQVDVFASGPYTGNPLAVFPEASSLTRAQMQKIASEMNLSETVFVTDREPGTYSVRIFTPREELPFAGHPTLGAAWVLRRLGRLVGTEVVQVSAAGETPVAITGDELWFERVGACEADLADRSIHSSEDLAAALGLDACSIGLEARELGRSGHLVPAFSDAGLKHLMIPVRDAQALQRISVDPAALEEISPVGAFCFTAVAAGRIRARGFFPSLGIAEDPATGSAVASLGVYLSDRVGPIDLRVDQGVEMGRPSALLLRAGERSVRVGGRCAPIFEGALEVLPHPV